MSMKLFPLLAVGVFAVPCLASPVAWNTAFEVASDNDISLSGRQVVYAVNGGAGGGTGGAASGTIADATTTVTIGGRAVAFQGVAVKYGVGSAYAAPTYGDVTDHLLGQNYDVTFGVQNTVTPPGTTFPLASFDPAADGNPRTTYNIPTGNAGLDSVLESQLWVDGRNTTTSASPSELLISLNHLTAGQKYQVQLIAGADSRASTTKQSANQFIADDGLGNTAGNLDAYADLNGDGVKHVTSVVGSFTADSTGSQMLDLGIGFGRQAGVSAIIVTTVPEPTVLCVVGAFGVLLKRRRRTV